MQVLVAIFLFLVCLAGLELFTISLLVRRFNFIPTLILILVTGIIGAIVARKNAKVALKNLLKGDFRSGPPQRQMFDAVAFFIAAALLIIPGIITDVAGLFLLFPWTRSALYKKITRGKMTMHSTSGGFSEQVRPKTKREHSSSLGADDVIDVEAVDVTDEK